MKLYRNLADGIVEGVQEILGNRGISKKNLISGHVLERSVLRI